MGSVYLAHDSQLSRKVAIKVPKFTDDETADTVQRFYREARSAATLRHANICPVYDVGEIDGRHYIAMAYIDGKPLAAYVSQVKPPTPRSAAMVIRKLALGLQQAHDQGIVHRDLKPANIMIDSRNEPIIMDFGLARRAEQSDDTRLTKAGTIIGTPAYMSPEQLDGRPEKIGPPSDVYALGVLLYELLTGKLPFAGTGSVISVIKDILTKIPPDPSEARPEVEPALAEICCKAMSKEEADRHLSMNELAAELTNYLKSGGADSSGTKLASAVDPDVVRLEEQCKLVRSLCGEGQFEAAESILQKIVGSAGPKTAKYAKWAESQLPVVKTQILQKTQVAQASNSSLGNSSPSDLSLPLDLMEQLPTSSTDTNRLATETLSYSAPSNYSHSKKPSLSKMPPWMIAAIAGPIVLCILLVGVIIGGWFTGPPGPPPPQNGHHEEHEHDEHDEHEEHEEHDRERNDSPPSNESQPSSSPPSNEFPPSNIEPSNIEPSNIEPGIDDNSPTVEADAEENSDQRQVLIRQAAVLEAKSRLVNGVINFDPGNPRDRRFSFVAESLEKASLTLDDLTKFYNVDEAVGPTFAQRILAAHDIPLEGGLKDGKIDSFELDEPFLMRQPEGRHDNVLDEDDLNSIAVRFGAHPPELDLGFDLHLPGGEPEPGFGPGPGNGEPKRRPPPGRPDKPRLKLPPFP